MPAVPMQGVEPLDGEGAPPLGGSGVPPPVRLAAVQMLMCVNQLEWDEAQRVETGLARFHRVEAHYTAAAQRLGHNLHFHPALRRQFAPEDLASLTDDQLRGPILQRFITAEAERADAISEMLRQKYNSVGAVAVTSSTLRCRSCDSADVSWQQKQTRGADEAMTIFCTCASCGNRWKMS